MGDEKPVGIHERTIKVKFAFPDDLQSHFVTNFIIQHQPESFVLSFFEVWPPAILGNEEEQRAAIESFEEIEAKCIARMVITPSKVKELLAALKDNVEKYDVLIAAINSSGTES
ncbi:MAG: DUF3467 domain-containing protein [Chloroflexi bacterium]|nr:DUF3467 domain-containing protein [Chloroflexota bacterium]